MGYTQFNDDVFVIDSWPDTEEKEKVLLQLIKKVKVFGCPIILCGHYSINPEIQKLVDYYIYDSNNDILLEKDFEAYGINSDRWSEIGEYTLINKTDFHHDYAIWLTMKNAFNFVKQLGKQYIHFLEYDNLPDEIQYRQSFMEYIRTNDAVVYEYSEGSTKESNPYSSAYIFSIKTDVALKMINLINSKEEYFKNKPDSWQLEKQLYQSIKKVTNSVYVSKYIPNDNELNIFAAWNRNGILKNGAILQTYLGVDDAGQLFVHFISGFSEYSADEDYLVEINYRVYKKFHTVKIGEYKLERLGEYIQNENVEIFYRGVEIFKQKLKDDINKFRRKNKLTKKNTNTNRKMNINFVDGPFVEILENANNTYNVQFINTKNNKIEFETNINSNHWAKCSIKYYIDWVIKIRGINIQFYYEYKFNIKNEKVYIALESKSLGDTLAWFPYVEEFRKKHECKVICSTFWNKFFEETYREIEFVTPETAVQNLYVMYSIGWFVDSNGNIDYNKNPNDFKPQPLQKTASDILGLEYKEIKPKIKLYENIEKENIVCIAIHSTAQSKYWNYKNGWQTVVDYLKNKGYTVILLSNENGGYMGNNNPTGVEQLPSGNIENIIKVLQKSKLFIGISSGLSWLSWIVGIPTIIISGCTEPYVEPFENIIRISTPENKCSGCFNKHTFDKGDWNWCPEHKETDRQFECSISITPEVVINSIKTILN